MLCHRGASMLVAVLLLVAAPSWTVGQPAVGSRPQAVDDRFVPEPRDLRVEVWAKGLTVPWDIAFLPDGRALVSERPGRIRMLGQEGSVAERPYAELDVAAAGEGGLMGLAVHPGFPDQPYVYAMYTARGGNRVVRLRHEGDTGSLDGVVIDNIPAARFHNGGRIAFGPDGMLYVTTGDAQSPQLAQDRGSLAGKILRLTPDGGVPQDNPFGSPVWSYGHRNPQGLAWEPRTGQLFVPDHGPSGEFGLQAWDEVNVIRRGGNYGWPRIVGAGGGQELIDPIVAWPDASVPPAGAAFYGGALYVATLRSEALVRIRVTPRQGGWQVDAVERLFASGPRQGRFGRLRAAAIGPDGALYVSTSNTDGRGRVGGPDRILRITAAR